MPEVIYDPSKEVNSNNFFKKIWKPFSELGTLSKTVVVSVLVIAVGASTPAGIHYMDGLFSPTIQLTDATVDGVSLHIHESYLQKQLFAQGSATGFISTDPTDPIQITSVTSSYGAYPYRQFSVEALHYGQSDQDLSISNVKPNSVDTIRSDIIKTAQSSQGSQTKTATGPTANIFGSDVPSTTILQNIQTAPGKYTPVASVNWLKEDGGRVYIVDAEQEMPAGTTYISDPAVMNFVNENQNLQLNSDNLSAPSTQTSSSNSSVASGSNSTSSSTSSSLGSNSNPVPAPAPAPTPAPTDDSSSSSLPGDTYDVSDYNQPDPTILPDNYGDTSSDSVSFLSKVFRFHLPIAYAATAKKKVTGYYANVPWWNGLCDYKKHPGSRSIYVWRGLSACVPGPVQGGYDVNVAAVPGSPQITEWECVELISRYMYIRWGIKPYVASGADIYYNWSQNGNNPSAIRKNSSRVAPHTGDVIAFWNSKGGPGHAAIVIGRNVDSKGNGSITIMQQNWQTLSQTEYTLQVKKWTVQSPASYPRLVVAGWLHISQYYNSLVGPQSN